MASEDTGREEDPEEAFAAEDLRELPEAGFPFEEGEAFLLTLFLLFAPDGRFGGVPFGRFSDIAYLLVASVVGDR